MHENYLRFQILQQQREKKGGKLKGNRHQKMGENLCKAGFRFIQ